MKNRSYKRKHKYHDINITYHRINDNNITYHRINDNYNPRS